MCLQPDGKDDLVKDFRLEFTAFGDVTNGKIIGVRHRVDGMDTTADEAYAFILGIVIKPFKFFAVGSHVHEKNGTFQSVSGMLFGDDRLLDGIHTAHR